MLQRMPRDDDVETGLKPFHCVSRICRLNRLDAYAIAKEVNASLIHLNSRDLEPSILHVGADHASPWTDLEAAASGLVFQNRLGPVFLGGCDLPQLGSGGRDRIVSAAVISCHVLRRRLHKDQAAAFAAVVVEYLRGRAAVSVGG